MTRSLDIRRRAPRGAPNTLWFAATLATALAGVLAGLACVSGVAQAAPARGASTQAASAHAAPVQAAAVNTGGVRTLTYRGIRLEVPAGWPIVRLATDPTACVRFNRHAVYLGTPGAGQLCPATAIGRTEAILVEPSGGAGAGRTALGGSAAVYSDRRHGVTVTVTWNHDRALVERILGRGLKPTSAPAAVAPRAPGASERPAIGSHATSSGGAGTSGGGSLGASSATSTSSSAGEVYTGPGFDACSAPSLATLAAWGASPYRAVGIYIGGANIACTQPNLTAAWVAQAGADGWHLIPTFVGLQAPGKTCDRCTAITPAQATTEGTADAQSAVTAMEALGLGPGNPVYDDMEGYSSGSATTPAVLAYLEAWTTTLHADHYLSGVYSSGASGISDLAAQYGTTYVEPDDVWVADWNGQASTTDPYVPSGDWTAHQRVHQYESAHNETYGGVTINIDSDQADAATAASAPVAPPVPALAVRAVGDGAITLAPSLSGGAPVTSWSLLGGDSPATLIPIGAISGASASPSLTVHSAFPYYAAEAFGAAGAGLGTSAPVALPPQVVIYGHSAYTPLHGLGAVPVGCFTGAACRIRLRFAVGRTTLATTGPEPVGSGRSALVYFELTAAARRRLAAARGGRLAVTVTAVDVSGARAQAALSLIEFTTAGSGPRRRIVDAPALRIVGTTDFVGGGGVGGLLAGCAGTTPCDVSTTISVGRVVIARTGPEFIGANELGYLFFKLTPAGRRLLAAAKGNLLGARVVTVAELPVPLGYGDPGTATATAEIALVSV